jgi:peptidoglycan/xylan/chitin deacetylase (PgdA/CDA1 family)
LLLVLAGCGTSPTAVTSPTPWEPVITPSPTPHPSESPAAEWKANLHANSQAFQLNRDVALIDMTSGREVGRVGPGPVTVAYETSVGGLAYWMTDFSVSRNLPNGLLKDEVSAAVNAPAASPTPHVLPPSLAGAEWTRLPTSDKVVALTFDAGGNDAGVTPILNALAAAGVPGTFFMTGRWVEVYPARAKQISALYPVGNHTYDHPYLTKLSDAQVQEEIVHAQLLITSVTGRDPRPLFRFPYGNTDARTLADAHALGYGGIRWTVDTLGWEGRNNGQSAASVQQRVMANLKPGEIVLMHVGAATDGSTLDADALPAMIKAIRAAGYSLALVGAYA